MNRIWNGRTIDRENADTTSFYPENPVILSVFFNRGVPCWIRTCPFVKNRHRNGSWGLLRQVAFVHGQVARATRLIILNVVFLSVTKDGSYA